jgi:RecA-family ATPase
MIDEAAQDGFSSRVVSTLVPRPIDWFWPGRLATANWRFWNGDPGLGKSLLTLDLCARLSRGLPFPDGAPSGEPSASLIINGEDGACDTVRPRLEAMGADLDRIHVLNQAADAGMKPFRLPTHTEALCRAVKQTAARLVVIDPIMAFLDTSVAVGSDQNVRQALAPLA